MTIESRVGEVLASKYRLEELLGSGGMGHVYRAVNQHVGRPVAIKVLRREHAQNLAIVERFLREARAANLVRHPNVVDVLDIGVEETGVPFIVQELLHGEDLAHFVARRGGKLQLDEVFAVLLPVVDAVAEAHAREVVHRDLKPENIFLVTTPRGPVPKLLDFGISKVRSADVRATEIGVTMGTPAYMPPEQVQGARDADSRSDVWALGVMLFELIAGRLPFDAQDAPALFVAIATQNAPKLSDVVVDAPPEISRIIGRCLRRAPSERYPNAAELAHDLRSVMYACVRGASVPSSPSASPVSSSSLLSANPDARGLADERGGSSSARLAAAPALARTPPHPPTPAPGPPPKSLPKLPSLPPPAPRAAPPSAPRVNAALPKPAPIDDGPLTGVGLAPGPPSTPRMPTQLAAKHVDRHRDAEPRADLSGLFGFGAVGLAAILATGLLMKLAHRPEGWPAVRLLLPGEAELATAVHALAALVFVVFGALRCRRGLRKWNGDLMGGRSAALVDAAIGGAAFFGCVELLSAIS